MIKILADQNFNGRILRGLLARIPDLDIIRTEDHGIKTYPDPDIIGWAAERNRVIFTHDERTFDNFAYRKIEQSEKMCGVVIIPASLLIGQAIEELMMAIQCQTDEEWPNSVLRLPL